MAAMNILQYFNDMDDENAGRGLVDDVEGLFLRACKGGHVEIAKYIYDSMNKRYRPKWAKFDFTTVCTNGHLDVAEWLYSIKPHIYVNDEDPDLIYNFVSCVTLKKYDVASWLLGIYPMINIMGDDESNMIIFLCEDGNVDGFRWLYSINPEVIIDEVSNIFRNGVFYNKIEIIHFLEEIHPTFFTDGSVNMCEVFRYVCEKNMIHFVQWVHQKNPQKYTYQIMDDGSIYMNLPISNVTKYVETVDLCSICISESSNLITECSHQFCKSCIETWMRKTNTCPYCRRDISYNHGENHYMIFQIANSP